MPRQAPLALAGISLQVTQRDVNRYAIFMNDEDREHYYRLLCAATQEHGIAVHAYVFMGNHVHLLLTSPQRNGLPRATRNVGQCYVQAFNRRHRRCGTLWQGRFKSFLVDSEHYRWSSVHASLSLQDDVLVTPQTAYLALDSDPLVRAKAYGEWLHQGVSEDDLHRIREHLQKECALGDRTFRLWSSGPSAAR